MGHGSRSLDSRPHSPRTAILTSVSNGCARRERPRTQAMGVDSPFGLEECLLSGVLLYNVNLDVVCLAGQLT